MTDAQRILALRDELYEIYAILDAISPSEENRSEIYRQIGRAMGKATVALLMDGAESPRVRKLQAVQA